MSDIHGNRARFRSILRQIRLRPEDRLYVLGDCVDRYPDGPAILRELCARPNVTVLLGNHEHMLLEALTKEHPENLYIRRWYKNGGDITHARLKRCTKVYRQELLALIRNLPLNAEVTCGGKTYLLVHGAPVGYSTRHGDEVMDAVWTRLTPEERMPEGKTVIFGHTPTRHYQADQPMSIWFGAHMIGIDCGCGSPNGRLACLRLDDMQVFYSEQEEPD